MEKTFAYDNYYDGDIRRDGVFVREDGMWHPSMAGWVELVQTSATRTMKSASDSSAVSWLS